MNSSGHLEDARGSSVGSSSRQWSVDPRVSVRGVTGGITGIRITIEGEQAAWTHTIGHISSTTETEGGGATGELETPMATGLLQARGSGSSEVSASCTVGPRVFEGQGDAEQREGEILGELHHSSGVGHPRREG